LQKLLALKKSNEKWEKVPKEKPGITLKQPGIIALGFYCGRTASGLRPYECSAQGQGEPWRGGRGATAPSIVRKIRQVQRGEQVPSDGGLALPKDVRMKPFSLKSFLHTNLDVLIFTLARGSNGFPGGHAHFDPGRPGFCPDEESCMSLYCFCEDRT
jgi:hypothetical protein